MRIRLGWRARLTAGVAVFALVGTGLTLAASTAHATDSKIFIGPATQCPDANTWDCTHPTTPPGGINQTSFGGNNVLRCVVDDCSGPFVQNNTTGNNTIECIQTAQPADMASQSSNQSCGSPSGYQSTTAGGNNSFTITQTATVSGTSLSLFTNRAQNAKQAAEVTQSTCTGPLTPAGTCPVNNSTPSGTNKIVDTQTVCETATSNFNVPASQAQEARQKLTVHKQISDSSRQDLIVNQQQACPVTSSNPTGSMVSTVQAPQAVQTQNVCTGPLTPPAPNVPTCPINDPAFSTAPANQWINIGPGDKNCEPSVHPDLCEMGMFSNTGINHAEFTQNENFSQKASGPGGVDAGLTKATQTQGSSLAPVLLFWRIDATNGCSEANVNQGAGVFGLNGVGPATQTKTWVQDASPNALAGGTKAQKQDDDLGSIIGGLSNSPCKANVTQNFNLSQTGSANNGDSHVQICGEYQDIHSKIGPGSSGYQTCTNSKTGQPPTTSQNQAVDQSQWQITNGCTDTSCQKSGITVTGTPITADKAKEGQSFTLPVATFTDSTAANATTDKATIDWGDNTSSAGSLSACSNGTCTVSGTHKYAEETSATPYTVKTTVTSADNSTTSAATSTASVGDSDLHGQSKTLFATNNSLPEGTVVASFTDDDTTEYPTTSDYSATIDWGDGTAATPDVTPADSISADPTPGLFDVSGHHLYATPGPFTITVTIKDAGGAQTTVQSNAQGYQYLAHGSFAIGQPKSAIGTPVTWWGGSWSSANGISSPPSFKGYENTIDYPNIKCGAGPWKTTTGNSPPPPASGIPRFMAVIVTSSVTGGNVPTGNITHLVVVDTLGNTYQPDPSHPGTGIVVGTIC